MIQPRDQSDDASLTVVLAVPIPCATQLVYPIFEGAQPVFEGAQPVHKAGQDVVARPRCKWQSKHKRRREEALQSQIHLSQIHFIYVETTESKSVNALVWTPRSPRQKTSSCPTFTVTTPSKRCTYVCELINLQKNIKKNNLLYSLALNNP